MIGVVAAVLGAAVAAVAAFMAVMLIGFRTENKRILRFVRRMNKHVMNPRQLRTAGRPGAYAALLRHRGRKSGNEYETPIGVPPADDGDLVVALPYGPDTDWLRNVRAAGSATLVFEGDEYVVSDPRVVPIETTPVAALEPATVRVFGVRSALRLRARPVPSDG